MAELHGGKLKVVSEPGEGSRFSFRLPMADYSLKENAVGTPVGLGRDVPDIATPANLVGGNFHILAVNDDPVNLKVIFNFLSSSGKKYAISGHSDGLEALSFIESNGAPDMMLLDIMMPRMNGFEVLKTLRERFSEEELCVIVLKV